MNFGKEFEEIIIKHTRRFFGARDEAFHVSVCFGFRKNTVLKYEHRRQKVYSRPLGSWNEKSR